MTRPLFIESMHGMGDNIFIRPFVRAAADYRAVFLSTPWPEIFEDLPLKFVRKDTRLRTQAKNLFKQSPSRWVPAPSGADIKRLGYGHPQLTTYGSITKTIEHLLPLGNCSYNLDLPVKPLPIRNKVALIRPVTVRREWTNTARNPDPKYVAQIAEVLMSTHRVKLIADLVPNEEWLEGPVPPHHEAFVKGELGFTDLMNEMAQADIVVGGVGWIVPMAIAMQTRAFIILGGQGAHNAPSVVTDPRMNLDRIGWAVPDRYCQCAQMRHPCNKTISNLAAQWNIFVSRVTTQSSTFSPLAD